MKNWEFNSRCSVVDIQGKKELRETREGREQGGERGFEETN